MHLISVCVSEASKLVMSYVAAVCGKGQEVNKVKEQLLQSNPVLEGEWRWLEHPSLHVDGVCINRLLQFNRSWQKAAKIWLGGQAYI